MRGLKIGLLIGLIAMYLAFAADTVEVQYWDADNAKWSTSSITIYLYTNQIYDFGSPSGIRFHETTGVDRNCELRRELNQTGVDFKVGAGYPPDTLITDTDGWAFTVDANGYTYASLQVIARETVDLFYATLNVYPAGGGKLYGSLPISIQVSHRTVDLSFSDYGDEINPFVYADAVDYDLNNSNGTEEYQLNLQAYYGDDVNGLAGMAFRNVIQDYGDEDSLATTWTLESSVTFNASVEVNGSVYSNGAVFSVNVAQNSTQEATFHVFIPNITADTNSFVTFEVISSKDSSYASDAVAVKVAVTCLDRRLDVWASTENVEGRDVYNDGTETIYVDYSLTSLPLSTDTVFFVENEIPSTDSVKINWTTLSSWGFSAVYKTSPSDAGSPLVSGDTVTIGAGPDTSIEVDLTMTTPADPSLLSPGDYVVPFWADSKQPGISDKAWFKVKVRKWQTDLVIYTVDNCSVVDYGDNKYDLSVAGNASSVSKTLTQSEVANNTVFQVVSTIENELSISQDIRFDLVKMACSTLGNAAQAFAGWRITLDTGTITDLWDGSTNNSTTVTVDGEAQRLVTIEVTVPAYATAGTYTFYVRTRYNNPYNSDVEYYGTDSIKFTVIVPATYDVDIVIDGVNHEGDSADPGSKILQSINGAQISKSDVEYDGTYPMSATFEVLNGDLSNATQSVNLSITNYPSGWTVTITQPSSTTTLSDIAPQATEEVALNIDIPRTPAVGGVGDYPPKAGDYQITVQCSSITAAGVTALMNFTVPVVATVPINLKFPNVSTPPFNETTETLLPATGAAASITYTRTVSAEVTADVNDDLSVEIESVLVFDGDGNNWTAEWSAGPGTSSSANLSYPPYNGVGKLKSALLQFNFSIPNAADNQIVAGTLYEVIIHVISRAASDNTITGEDYATMHVTIGSVFDVDLVLGDGTNSNGYGNFDTDVTPPHNGAVFTIPNAILPGSNATIYATAENRSNSDLTITFAPFSVPNPSVEVIPATPNPAAAAFSTVSTDLTVNILNHTEALHYSVPFEASIPNRIRDAGRIELTVAPYSGVDLSVTGDDGVERARNMYLIDPIGTPAYDTAGAGSTISVKPGDTAVFNIRLYNLANTIENYYIGVVSGENILSDWSGAVSASGLAASGSTDPRVIGETGTQFYQQSPYTSAPFSFSVNVTVPNSPAATAGVYSYVVFASSEHAYNANTYFQDGAGNFANATDGVGITIEVLYVGKTSAEIYSLDAGVTDNDPDYKVFALDSPSAGTIYNFGIKVRNRGNANDRFKFEYTAAAGLTASLECSDGSVLTGSGTAYSGAEVRRWEIFNEEEYATLHVKIPNPLPASGIYEFKIVIGPDSANNLGSTQEVVLRIYIGESLKADLLLGESLGDTTIGDNVYDSNLFSGGGGAINLSVDPGQTKSVYVKLQNESNVTTSFEVSWGSSAPAGTITPSTWNVGVYENWTGLAIGPTKDSPDLAAFTGEAIYRVDITPPSDAVAGDSLTLYVNASREGDTSTGVDSVRITYTVNAKATCDLIIAGNGDGQYGDGTSGGQVTVDASPSSGTIIQTLTVENESNYDTSFTIRAYDVPVGWRVRFNGVEATSFITSVLTRTPPTNKQDITLEVIPDPETPAATPYTVYYIYFKVTLPDGSTESVALIVNWHPEAKVDLAVGDVSNSASGEGVIDTSASGLTGAGGSVTLSASAGETVATDIVVINAGNVDLNFAVNTVNAPAGWSVTFGGATSWSGICSLAASRLTNTVQVHVPDATPQGSYNIIVAGTSTNTGLATTTDSVTITVNVGLTAGADLVISGNGEGIKDPVGGGGASGILNLNPGQSGTLEIKVINTGNAALSYLLSSPGLAGWTVEFGKNGVWNTSYTTANIAAGGYDTCEIRITPPATGFLPQNIQVVLSQGTTVYDTGMVNVSDNIPPTVEGATYEVANNRIVIHFSEPISPTTFNLNLIRVVRQSDGTEILGNLNGAVPTWSGDNKTVTLDLTADQVNQIEQNLSQTLELDFAADSARDQGGNPLAAQQVTLGILPDLSAPHIVSITWNRNGTYDVSDDRIVIVFDKPIDDSSCVGQDATYIFEVSGEVGSFGVGSVIETGATPNDSVIEINVAPSAQLPIHDQTQISCVPGKIKSIWGGVPSSYEWHNIQVPGGPALIKVLYRSDGFSQRATPNDNSDDVLILIFDRPINDTTIDEAGEILNSFETVGVINFGDNPTFNTMDSGNDNKLAIVFNGNGVSGWAEGDQLHVRTTATFQDTSGNLPDLLDYSLRIEDASAPYPVKAIYYDDDNNGLDKGDRIVVTFSKSIQELESGNNPLTYLSISHDTGSFGAGATITKYNVNSVVITLGDNPELNIWDDAYTSITGAALNVNTFLTTYDKGRYSSNIIGTNGSAAKMATNAVGIDIKCLDTTAPALEKAEFIDNNHNAVVDEGDYVVLRFSRAVFLNRDITTVTPALIAQMFQPAGASPGDAATLLNVTSRRSTREVIIRIGGNGINLKIAGVYPAVTDATYISLASFPYFVSAASVEAVGNADLTIDDSTVPSLSNATVYSVETLPGYVDPLLGQATVEAAVSEPVVTSQSYLRCDVLDPADPVKEASFLRSTSPYKVGWSVNFSAAQLRDKLGEQTVYISACDLAGNCSATIPVKFRVIAPVYKATAESIPSIVVTNSGVTTVEIKIKAFYDSQSTGINRIRVVLDYRNVTQFTDYPANAITKIIADGSEIPFTPVPTASLLQVTTLEVTNLGSVKPENISIFIPFNSDNTVTGEVKVSLYVEDTAGRIVKIPAGDVDGNSYNGNKLNINFINFKCEDYSVDVQVIGDLARIMAVAKFNYPVTTTEAAVQVKAFLIPSTDKPPLSFSTVKWENLNNKGVFTGITYIWTNDPDYWSSTVDYHLLFQNVPVLYSGVASEVKTPTFEIYQWQRYVWNAFPAPEHFSAPGTQRWFILIKDENNYGTPEVKVWLPSLHSWKELKVDHLQGTLNYYISDFELNESDLVFATTSVRTEAEAANVWVKVGESERPIFDFSIQSSQTRTISLASSLELKVSAKSDYARFKMYMVSDTLPDDFEAALSKVATRSYAEAVIKTIKNSRSLIRTVAPLTGDVNQDNSGKDGEQSTPLPPTTSLYAAGIRPLTAKYVIEYENATVSAKLPPYTGIKTSDGRWIKDYIPSGVSFLAIEDLEKPKVEITLLNVRDIGNSDNQTRSSSSSPPQLVIAGIDLGSGLATIEYTLTDKSGLEEPTTRVIKASDYYLRRLEDLDLPEGEWRLTLRAFDRAGNVTELTRNFYSLGRSVVNSVKWGPVPVSTPPFRVFVTADQTPTKVYLTIYDSAGEVVKRIVETPADRVFTIEWDLTTDDFKDAKRGVYLFKIKIEFADGNSYKRFGKLFVAR